MRWQHQLVYWPLHLQERDLQPVSAHIIRMCVLTMWGKSFCSLCIQLLIVHITLCNNTYYNVCCGTLHVWDLRFLPLCCWRFRSSAMWCSVIGLVKKQIFFILLDPKDEGSMALQNFVYYSHWHSITSQKTWISNWHVIHFW